MVFEEGFREVGRSLAAGRQLVREGVESAEAVLGAKKSKKSFFDFFWTGPGMVWE